MTHISSRRSKLLENTIGAIGYESRRYRKETQQPQTASHLRAIAGILNVPARSLMDGRPRTPIYSWVVAASDGRPTGYSEEQIDVDCLHQIREQRHNVIKDSDTLRHWLTSR